MEPQPPESSQRFTSTEQTPSSKILRSKTTLPSTQNIQTDDEQSPVTEETPKRRRKWRRVRRIKEELGPQSVDEVPGVTRLIISKFTQNQIQCTVGEDVTGENSWKYVRKEDLEENLEMTGEDSEFFAIKDEILNYPRPELFLGYIPDEVRPFDEFYMCLTEEAENTVVQIIEKLKKAKEERLNKSIYKEPRPWKTFGSEKEIKEVKEKPNRPFFEVELETEYPVFTNRCRFSLRLVEHARDGYMELLTTRTTFTNLQRKRITAEVQVTPSVTENVAQTFQGYPTNQSTQYEYTYEEIQQFSKEFREELKNFVDTEMNHINDTVYVNSRIDFYRDDYKRLIRDQATTLSPLVANVKEFTTLADVIRCRDKKITDLCWHPMWTGTLAIAYGKYGSGDYVDRLIPEEDEVTGTMYHTIPVLLWSFTDTLEAKLFLETPREVSLLSFCPYFDNILIGGLANGQIVIWDIKGKLETVETQEILTPAQQRYRALMNSLMTWMKNTKDPKMVRATAISDLEYSHKGVITGIRWVLPFREVSKSGKLSDIPEDEDRRSLQFITSSRDGTLLIWDMLVKPVYSIGGYRPQKKLRRLKQRPPALVEDVSQWKELNRVFKPIFKILLFAPNSSRPLPLLAVSTKAPPIKYEEIDPDPKRSFKITNRRKFKPIFKRLDIPTKNEIVAGSTEGDFLVCVWDGFEFNAGEIVNKETARITNFAKYHDGPVISLTRSILLLDVILTVGGKVFCLWNTEFPGKPFFWRRGTCRYTHCVWNNYRPAIFRLSRNDGQIELWHLNVRSDTFVVLETISGKSLGGSFTHPLSMKQNIVGMVDHNGFFRLFYTAHRLLSSTEQENAQFCRFCEREVARKINLVKWQENWKIKYENVIREKHEQDLLRRKHKEDDEQKEKQQMEEEKKQTEKDEAKQKIYLATPEPGKYTEWAMEQWKIKEEIRMNQVLLGKKALDIDLLQRQQQPLIRATEENNKKKRKEKQRLGNAQEIFLEVVAMLFPEAIEELPPPAPNPYVSDYLFEVMDHHFSYYKQLEEVCDEYIEEHPYSLDFIWMDTIKTGKQRKNALDVFYATNIHKQRLVQDKERERLEAEEAETAAAFARQAPPPRRDSELSEESDMLIATSTEAEEQEGQN